MDVFLATTTAATPLSRPQATCLKEFNSGSLAGRKVAVFRSAANALSVVWADRPYKNWSTPQTIVSTVANRAFDITLVNDASVLVAYIDMTTYDVMTVNLAWNGSTWDVGTPVVAFTGDNNFDPSVVTAGDQSLWLTWTRLSSPPVRHVHTKSSSDGGSTWGTGPTGPGDILHSGGVTATSALAAAVSRLFIVYYHDAQLLAVRSRLLDDTEWSVATVLATGLETSTSFALAARPDGLLAVVYGVTSLWYREFDGTNLNPAVELQASAVQSPAVWWRQQSPVIAYVEPAGSDQAFVKYIDRRTGEFAEPALLAPANDVFKTVLAYNNAAGTFVDLTDPAQTAAVGDLLHPHSGALLAQAGDALYCGLDLPFTTIRANLSTPGTGGSLSYSYWDGSRWIAFTPVAGTVAFDTTEFTTRLWTDRSALPPNWQKVSVDGHSRFWIRIEVLADFTTPPVGTMINSLADIEALVGGI